MPPGYTISDDTSSSNPQVFIEGQLYRSSTFPMHSFDGDLPFIDDNDQWPLDELLRHYSVGSADDPREHFWSEKLLYHILSRNRILAQLMTYENLTNAKYYLNVIRPENNQFSRTSHTFVKTFAILILIGRGHEIPNFIEDQVSDQSLPLCRPRNTGRGKVDLRHRSAPNQPLECFRRGNWRPHDKESFEDNQRRVLVPYFELDRDGGSSHYSLDEKTILPFCVISTSDILSHTSTQPSGQGGAYGSVTAIKIDRCSHGFGDLLRKLHLDDNLFALKVLHDQSSNDENKFRHELEQLRRFNGLINPHLVTLLATFTRSKRYYFIFPHARSTLEYLWEVIDPQPTLDLETVRWVSSQLSGIMSAIDIIHEPNHLHLSSSERRYGRHGDIKPDNILWFQSSNDRRGILVVTDMGLSAFHRDNSKSGIARYTIARVPGYQPPECDVKGGKISRAYDIWTLGCLFLEILTWSMGGWEMVEEFHRQRKAVHITGAINELFFTLKTVKGRESRYVAQVKRQVTEWFIRLHRDERCPQFIHDALDIIQNEMLVVLSTDRKRSSAGQLNVKFKNLNSKCMNDRDRDYCLRGISTTRIFRKATAVEANLRDDAIEAIREFKPELQEYDPHRDTEIRTSMLPYEFERMDVN